jgi:electron transport complex protein RnfC
MKLFDLRGGVHPEGRKDLSLQRHIRVLPLPKTLYGLSP